MTHEFNHPGACCGQCARLIREAQETRTRAEALLARAHDLLDRCHYRLTHLQEAPALREDIAVLMAAICEERR